MALSSVDVNYMIYLYLLESGYPHSAFIFGNETKAKDTPTSPGEFCPSALVDLLQKGILYKELQTRIAANGNPVRDITSSELIRAKHPLDPLKSTVVSPIQAPRRRLTDHCGHISAQAWHPSEVVLATGAADASARIYHMTSNVFDRQSCDLLQHAVPGNIGMSEVAAVAWSPDGSMLLCEEGLPPLQGVRFSWSGKYIAAHGGAAGAVIVWDAKTGKQIASLHRHSGAVFGLCWGPGERFATCGQDSLLQMSRVRTVPAQGPAGGHDTTVQWERNINMHTGHVNDVDCSSEGDWWASCSDSGTVRVFETVCSLTIPVAVAVPGLSASSLHNEAATAASSLHNEAATAASSLHNEAARSQSRAPLHGKRQEDSADGMEGVEEEGVLLADAAIPGVALSHELPVHSCRFSPAKHRPGDPDEVLLATSSSAERTHAANRAKPPTAEACIKVWDCLSVSVVRKLTWPEAVKAVYMYNVQWSPDARYITCATFIPKVCVWDARTGEVALHVDVKADVTVASWSFNGDVLAVSMADGTTDLIQWTG